MANDLWKGDSSSWMLCLGVCLGRVTFYDNKGDKRSVGGTKWGLGVGIKIDRTSASPLTNEAKKTEGYNANHNIFTQ